MANYKLLRSLVAVLLASAAACFVSRVPVTRVEGVLEVGLALAMYLCFVRMYDWTRFFTFDYARLLQSVGVPGETKSALSAPDRLASEAVKPDQHAVANKAAAL